MEVKTILVALAAGPSAQTVTHGAVIMARAHQAQLLGVHVIDILPFAGYLDADTPAEILEMQREKLFADAKQTEATFKQICDEAQVDAQWQCIEGSTHHLLDQYSRYCDLVCVSAPTTTEDNFSSLPKGEDLVFSTGRPVLLIPEAFEAAGIGKHVTIAWNGSREAAKAISNAMPILSLADKVSVVCVVDDDCNDAQARSCVEDMGRYLERHGVTAQEQVLDAGNVAPAQYLHDWARVEGSDLLVMGAYGHARIREFILGGVTRWSVRHSTIPVLMTH